MADSIDQINGYFSELNMNKRLLAVLQLIQVNPDLYSQLEFEDFVLLQTVVRDVSLEQASHSKTVELSHYHQKSSLLHRQFVQGIQRSRAVVDLSWNQLSTVPSKQFYLRYEDQFDFGPEARKNPKSQDPSKLAAKK